MSAEFDALVPADMAAKAETIGIKKAGMDLLTMFALSILAGAFIAMGAIFSTTSVAGMAGVTPYGIIRLVAGLTFTLGLILVVVAEVRRVALRRAPPRAPRADALSPGASGRRRRDRAGRYR